MLCRLMWVCVAAHSRAYAGPCGGLLAACVTATMNSCVLVAVLSEIVQP